MHGFPLTLSKVTKRMHKGKRGFSTEREAWDFVKHGAPSMKQVYTCPFCGQYHISSHEFTPRYAQERDWIVWRDLVERGQLTEDMF